MNLYNEFRHALMSDDVVEKIEQYYDSKKLNIILPLPETFLDWKMEQNNPNHHLTVWGHTITALKNLQIITKQECFSKEDKLCVNAAILLHDIGKLNPKIHGCKIKNNIKYTTYYCHEIESMYMADHLLSKMNNFSRPEINRIKKFIDGSRRVNPNFVSHEKKCTLGTKTLKRFVKFAGTDWKNIIFMSMADFSSKKENGLENFKNIYYMDMINKINNLDKLDKNKLLITGSEIINMVNKTPGPWVGGIIQKMAEWQSKNLNATKEDAIEFVSKLVLRL